MAKKKIDKKTRQGVLKAHSDGLSAKMIAELFGISRSSVNRIVKDTGPRDTQERVTWKTAERERLKKLEDLERRINLLEERVIDLIDRRIRTGPCRSR